ncbi:MAG: glycoside hydrolase family 27 protein [Defluviitaleaceae bacterium]|nr:glycoside hydrolase family 27 protein [Defluviitaleaceae bacterium]
MLVKTPPMGWNSWNTFGPDVCEKVVLETADAMVKTGLKDAGYEYVVIDDCWSEMERDENGKLAANPEKFPRGMKFVADCVHKLGLKFGMYSSAGIKTCGRFPGSFDHEYLDALTFAEFGVDYLKYDFCYKPVSANGPSLYHRMGMALKATGRDIVFSACNWGGDSVETWIRSTGAHLYRSTGDISDNFPYMCELAVSQIGKLAYSGAGCFNDIDMLVTGMHNQGNMAAGGMTDDEYLFHFALWCVLQSPLMIGCDVRSMSDATKAALTNKELIRIDQDEECRPIYPVDGKPVESVFVGFKHLSNNEYLLAVFNFKDTPLYPGAGNMNLHDIGLPAVGGLALRFTDIMTGEDVGVVRDMMFFPMPGHSFKLYRGVTVPVK